jgi:hypothetical protein
MYEHHTAPLLPKRQFYLRLAGHVLVVGVVVLVSLVVGMVGYRYFAQKTWVDAFLNASMLLGGMGPVGDLPNDRAKMFAGLYALYAGLVFIASAGIIITPIAHRILHRLHMDDE